jgi:hypothetical protein
MLVTSFECASMKSPRVGFRDDGGGFIARH